jgi:PKD repeat protein
MRCILPVTKGVYRTQAVSEVMGTLILVAVVMVGIALIGTLLLSQPHPTEIPHFHAIISNESESVYIFHKGGDALEAGEYQILVDGVDRTSSFENSGNHPWSVGETLSYTSPTIPQKVAIVFTGDGKGGASLLKESDLTPVLRVPSCPPSPPYSVDWSSSPGFGNITALFQFTDNSTGKNLSCYSWDFNNGTRSAEQNPALTFLCTTDTCVYDISHSATDSCGTDCEVTSWLNRSAYVTVYGNLTPTVTFTQNKTSGPEDLSVQFDATQVGAIRVDNWSWNFGAGEMTSTLEDPSHTYASQGIYTVSLTATNTTLGVTTVTKNNLIWVTPPWYSCGWLYRKSITIDKARVTADLTNFPVLISLADPDLSARAQGDGDDILFTSADGTTKLSHEIESYSGGTLAAWVKVPFLPSGSNTTLFMYYGNSGASSQQDAENVWDADFKAVWHHQNSNFQDSTPNNNDGSNSGTTNVAAAKIAGARNYDGSNDYVQMGSGASIDQLWATGGTFSAWVYPEGLGGGSEGRIADKTNQAALTYGWNLFTNAGNTLRFRRAYATTVGTWTTPAISMSAWNYVVVTYTDGIANDPNIYINGNLVSESENAAPAGTARSDASYNLRTGNRAGGTNRAFDGIIDEIRASKTVRSPDWITTEYNNQNSPSTFHYPMTQEAWIC